MRVTSDQLSKEIALATAKLLMPKIRKLVKEEFKNLQKEMIYEQFQAKKKKKYADGGSSMFDAEYSNDDIFADDDEEEINESRSRSSKRRPENTIRAKSAVANRAKSKARELYEKFNDPVMALIADTEIPDEGEEMGLSAKIDNRTISEAGTINASNLGKEDIVNDPSQINYSDLIADIL